MFRKALAATSLVLVLLLGTAATAAAGDYPVSTPTTQGAVGGSDETPPKAKAAKEKSRGGNLPLTGTDLDLLRVGIVLLGAGGVATYVAKKRRDATSRVAA